MKLKLALALSVLSLMFSATALRADVLAGPITNAANGHVYYLLAPATWTASEVESVNLGGHLVTINDADENTWVYDTFASYGGVPRALWIGFTDRDSEGEFVWSSGEPVTYTNWNTGEPNDQGGQDFAHIYPPNDASGRARLWNDIPDISSANIGGVLFQYHGVVEVVPSTTVGTQTNAAIWTAVEIGWSSDTNKLYQVQWASSLSPTVWLDLGTSIQGNGTTNFLFDTVRGRQKRFYRVLELP